MTEQQYNDLIERLDRIETMLASRAQPAIGTVRERILAVLDTNEWMGTAAVAAALGGDIPQTSVATQLSNLKAEGLVENLRGSGWRQRDLLGAE